MAVVIFVFGLAFGSFANVVIYRLPKGKSIVRPGSRCTSCGKNVLWQDNIPLVSFVLLGGKCRFCKKKISSRYFLVELLAGLLLVFAYLKFGLCVNFFIYSVFSLAILVIGFIDIDTYLISDAIVLPGILLGLLFSVVHPRMHYELTRIESFLYSFSGMLIGGILLLLLGWVGKILFKKEAMGGGDVKLLAMIGAFLGWKSVFITIFLASLFGTVISLALIAMKKKTIEDYVPFGPYLGLGALVALLFKGGLFLGFFIN